MTLQATLEVVISTGRHYLRGVPQENIIIIIMTVITLSIINNRYRSKS